MMSGVNALAHESAPVVAWIKPQAVTAGNTVTSDIIDMRYWAECVAYVLVGAYAAGNDGSLLVKIQVSNDGSGFTSAVDLTEKTLTTSSWTGSTGDEAVGIIRWMQQEMVVSETAYRYARLSVRPSNQNLTCGAVVVGFGGRYQPGSDYDIAAVKEIIS